MTTIKKKFGVRLFQLRTDAGMTQASLAERTNLRIPMIPPPCSDSKRQGVPIHSATPGRSVATLVFISFS
jgi:transcriptional regulator with XRE-family HTH domain